MRAYLSGPISGTKDAIQRFSDAQKMLEQAGIDDVCNPSWLVKILNPRTTDREEYMGICLDLLGECDIVIQLDGWQESLGCQCEYGFARGQDIPCMSIEELMDEKKRNVMGMNGRKYLEDHFDVSRSVELLEKYGITVDNSEKQ